MIKTEDGSYTFYSPFYKENYHSLVGATRETLEKFLIPSGILEESKVSLLDIGFGIGYNALEAFLKAKAEIAVLSLEKNEALFPFCYEAHKESSFKMSLLKSLEESGKYLEKGKSLELQYGDARETVKNLKNSKERVFTHVFLDAFSPSVNPELWSYNFFRDLYDITTLDGKIITYSSSLAVVSAFLKVGFYLDYTEAVGRKRGGLIAYKNKNCVKEGLSFKDSFLLSHSIHSIPNIDKGNWNVDTIKRYRQNLQETAIKLGCLKPHKRALKILERELNE